MQSAKSPLYKNKNSPIKGKIYNVFPMETDVVDKRAFG